MAKQKTPFSIAGMQPPGTRAAARYCVPWPFHAGGYRTLLSLFAFSFAISTAGAQVYKWIDPDGSTHYGDQPPGDTRPAKVEIPATSFGGPTTVDYASILRRPIKSATAAPIDDCTATCCGPCKCVSTCTPADGVVPSVYGVDTAETRMGEYADVFLLGVPAYRGGRQRTMGFGSRGPPAMMMPHGVQWSVSVRGH